MSRARDLADSADNDITGTLTVDDITLSGNITVGGTVDGRDVATDGTKLDGVEANATADQTKADIDALNINADTLDGQHGSYYTAYADTAVSNLVDSAPTTLDTLNELAAALGDDPNFATTTATNIGTKVSKSGDTMTGALNFGDNVKAQFGAGSDLQIYHDGSNSYITDGGTGDLYLRGSANVRITDTDNNKMFLGQDGGEAQLYYNGAQKLATKNTGVTVTGALTATGNVTAYSDERLKDNVVTIESALDKVSEIRGVIYNRNDIEDAPRHAGVIAQEVEKVLPEVVQTDDDGIKTVAYGNMVGLLIEAIKELKAEIEELKNGSTN